VEIQTWYSYVLRPRLLRLHRRRLPQPTNAFDADNGIIVLVGPTQKAVVVHENHITRDSDFFSAALSEARIEGQVTIINLPSEDPVHLAYYLDWVYDRQLPTDIDQASLSVPSCMTADYANELLVLLSQLYVFGERMLDTVFRNALLDEMVRISNLEWLQPVGAISVRPPKSLTSSTKAPPRPLRLAVFSWTGVSNSITNPSTLCFTRKSSSSI